MSRTLPQIIMLNHAAWVNSKRMDARIKERNAHEDNDPVVFNGKRLSELNSEEMSAYYGEGGFGCVIHAPANS